MKRRVPSKTASPVRVAHVVEDLNLGGLEKVVAAIVAGLDRRRFSPEVWCLARGGMVAKWIAQAGTPVRVLGMRSYHNPLNVIRLAARLRSARIGIVHTHGYFAGTFGRLAAAVAGTPRVFCHVHTSHIDFYRRERIVDRCLAAVTSKIICISESVRRFVVAEEHIPLRKTCVVYNAVAPAVADEASDPPAVAVVAPRASPAIVSVGHLVRNKGHHVLLEAVEMLSRELPKLGLVIAGDGPEGKRLQRDIQRFRLVSRVTLAGVVERTDRLLRPADIFVLPSTEREGLSLAVLEAMDCGLPVIASRIGGVPEVVLDGGTGILVPPAQPKALAEAILRLVHNPAERRRMGASGQARVKRLFNKDKMIAEIEALYDSPRHPAISR
jgi:glycosyltransferase involved in cell wall biosynthesis